MTADTTDASYWLNWRFLICAIWILSTMVVASVLIWKYEGFKKSRTGRRAVDQRETVGTLYEDEAWKTCLKGIHPAWLLAYRIIAFVVMLGLIVANVALDGAGIFYFYTQWTFVLVTLYFGYGSLVSLRGIYKHRNRIGEDEERGAYVAPTLGENGNTSNGSKSLTHEEYHGRKGAGACEYIFQIIYQMCGGAVAITDCIFWLVLYPFLTSKDYKTEFCNRFPLFRIAYFVLWTGVFVALSISRPVVLVCSLMVCFSNLDKQYCRNWTACTLRLIIVVNLQWIFHACKSMWWPYPFLDLSSSYAPLWYLGVGLMHLPCYGVFALIIRIKNLLLSRAFPESYQNER
ncbi:hypothetical protein D8674_037263 [Pyrus ussuriensis x Pyrus communis]|uniref:Transmembrane protein n=1 Tax=Pyrus ussuriensis x Pyrus communis TaxID=2448454 RepID=A0A5N5G8A5_9ROSA|nr:hypothetical protein D8674_037263 [Pyrus ussuriensis x Pyrus communis]